MTATLESILEKVRLGRQRNPIPLNACQVCGGPGRKTRVEEVGSLFCSSLCNKAEYHYAELFQLGGMKRVVEADAVRKGLGDLPSEIQAMIILMAYDYRIDSMRDWELLTALREFHFEEFPGEGAQLKLTINNEVIPRFQYVRSGVFSILTLDEVAKFKGLFSVQFPFYSIKHDLEKFAETGITFVRPTGDWTNALLGMKSLKRLWFPLLEPEQMITIDLTQLTHIRALELSQIDESSLSQMVLIEELRLFRSNIGDEAIKPLTNLKILKIEHESNVTGQLIQSLTNLTELQLVRNKNLRDVDIEPLTQLKALSLTNTLITGNGIGGMTKLETLMAPYLPDLTDQILGQFPNLTKLDIRGMRIITEKSLNKMKNLRYLDIGYLRNSISFGALLENRTNLTSLNISGNRGFNDSDISKLIGLRTLSIESYTNIGDQGIMNLTNLTRLSIRGNPDITHVSILKLKQYKLRELHVDSSQYYMKSMEKLGGPNQFVILDTWQGFNM